MYLVQNAEHAEPSSSSLENFQLQNIKEKFVNNFQNWKISIPGKDPLRKRERYISLARINRKRA